MAAPKGNRFWELRSKHGRDKLFAEPELLWDAATEYFKWCKSHPWLKIEQGKGAAKGFYDEKSDKVVFPPNLISIPTERPFTLHGLCLYLGCNTGYFRTFKAQLPEGEEDFNTVISRIEETIYQQKFEGAAVGAFNANIISRDLGLKESIDQTINGTVHGDRQIFVLPPSDSGQFEIKEGE